MVVAPYALAWCFVWILSFLEFPIVVQLYDKYKTKFQIVNFLYDKIVNQLYDIWFVTRDKLKREIGKRIVELREQKSWSQSDLARACNKDRQAIEKLENGKVNPTLYSLLEVANALEVSLSKLVDLS